MELRVQYIMFDSLSLQHTADKFGSFNCNCTNQYRLLFCMSLNYSIDNCVEFLFLCHINSIFMVNTDYRSVRRDFYNVHCIDITELFLLCDSCTGHTALLVIFVKEVLECDRCQSLALTFDLNMLFCFNRLMKTVRITASRHDTSGKFINDKNLIIFNNVILILMHQVVRTKSKDNVMLDLQILRISQVLNMEEFLNLMNTLLSKVYDLIFLIYNEVTCLDNFLAHDSCHLCHLVTGFTTL